MTRVQKKKHTGGSCGAQTEVHIFFYTIEKINAVIVIYNDNEEPVPFTVHKRGGDSAFHDGAERVQNR